MKMRYLALAEFSFLLLIASYCLGRIKHYAAPESFGLMKTRLVSILGVCVMFFLALAMFVTILLPAIVLVIPALLCFAALAFRPTFLRESKAIRPYLSTCLVVAITWTSVLFISNLTQWGVVRK